MEKRPVFVAISLLFAASALAGCTAQGSENLQLGVLLPLSGDGASFGEPALNGVRLAVDEINDEGGIDGQEVELVVGDTRFPNTDVAVSEFERLVGQGVPFVIGATASDSSAAAKERANEAEVILMSPGSTRPALTGPDHGYFFRVIASDSVQGPQSAQFLMEDLGADETVVMYEQTAYGRGLEEEFVQAYQGLGGTIRGAPIAWEHDETTYDGKAAEAVENAGGHIWIAGQAPHIGNLIKAIRSQGFTGTIMTTEAVENPSIFDVAGDAVAGTIFTKSGPGLGSERAQAFTAAYEARFDEAPGVYSPFAYDAAHVAFAAFAAVGAEGSDIKTWLEDDAAVPGRVTTDTIRFNQNGDVTTGGYDLWEVVYEGGEGGFRPYDR